MLWSATRSVMLFENHVSCTKLLVNEGTDSVTMENYCTVVIRSDRKRKREHCRCVIA